VIEAVQPLLAYWQQAGRSSARAWRGLFSFQAPEVKGDLQEGQVLVSPGFASLIQCSMHFKQ
jgi:predicted trehalose synthase